MDQRPKRISNLWEQGITRFMIIVLYAGPDNLADNTVYPFRGVNLWMILGIIPQMMHMVTIHEVLQLITNKLPPVIEHNDLRKIEGKKNLVLQERRQSRSSGLSHRMKHYVINQSVTTRRHVLPLEEIGRGSKKSTDMICQGNLHFFSLPINPDLLAFGDFCEPQTLHERTYFKASTLIYFQKYPSCNRCKVL